MTAEPGVLAGGSSRLAISRRCRSPRRPQERLVDIGAPKTQSVVSSRRHMVYHNIECMVNITSYIGHGLVYKHEDPTNYAFWKHPCLGP